MTGCLSGDVIRWEQQLRFRHLATRQYLCITTDRRVTLTADSKDPRTVFRLHPVIKVLQTSVAPFSHAIVCVGKVISGVCDFVRLSVCVCPCYKRKTTRAINAQLDRHTVHGSLKFFGHIARANPQPSARIQCGPLSKGLDPQIRPTLPNLALHS